MPISFYNADRAFVLSKKAKLKKFIQQQVKSTGYCVGPLSYVFCSDEFLLRINRQFLNHDYYTDIITFPILDSENILAGEIYISIDRVKENAEQYARAPLVNYKNSKRNIIKKAVFEDELHRVMFHGVLHLLGQSDRTKPQKERMRKLENEWLKEFKGFVIES